MKIEIVCSGCGISFKKDHWNIIGNKPSFCSKRCANLRLNVKKWKNHTKKILNCIICGTAVDLRSKSKICLECYAQQTKNIIEKITVGELKSKHKTKNNPWYSAEIRKFCRTYNSDLLNKPCQKCGYDKYTELCHIKPISSFSDKSTIEEINNKNNIIVLCPNHHWEFDNGLFTI